MPLEFSDLLRPDLRQLLGFEVNSEGRGFQGAHVLGRSAVASQLDDLFNFMNNGTPAPLGADHVSNGVLLPGSNRSNTGVASAIMGTAAHSGANVAAFDELFFDAGAREGQSNKFINKLLDSIELNPSNPDYKSPQQMRIEFKNGDASLCL